jgi:hypothetical protein|tara:strand:+ start:722 stop:991 length:270 start_codon:yes stop_codon:yes gene_type:complete
MKGLQTLFFVLLVLILATLTMLYFTPDKDNKTFKPNSGNFYSKHPGKFVSYHHGSFKPIIDREDPKRYAVKLYEYHDKKEKARRKTFYR